jgi:transposase
VDANDIELQFPARHGQNERELVVGRRAWLFADTIGGAKASANLYSLVETCKANSVDAYRYLTELFKGLPYARSADHYEALLPWKLGKREIDAVT